ncbi:hypothetical protein [Burkholderia sp. AU45388]|uniref:hypothetical protein n=1 Tax=Burkholderia sp. AU45388 TaxID=3059206 RepID=UPI002656797F|nr:hypothetical protein [Burkholderia sp. AU45388]MDN7430794.1 hypothetical protein [Burkholderia sp. AU45388]
MDYVLANFMAVMAAVIFSVFTSFIASRSGRLIYRKIMWGYLATLLIAAIVVTVMQLPFAILAFGSLFSCIFGVFVQLGIAVKLGHLAMTDRSGGGYGDNFAKSRSFVDDYTNSWKQSYHGPNDSLRNW